MAEARPVSHLRTSYWTGLLTVGRISGAGSLLQLARNKLQCQFCGPCSRNLRANKSLTLLPTPNIFAGYGDSDDDEFETDSKAAANDDEEFVTSEIAHGSCVDSGLGPVFHPEGWVRLRWYVGWVPHLSLLHFSIRCSIHVLS